MSYFLAQSPRKWQSSRYLYEVSWFLNLGVFIDSPKIECGNWIIKNQVLFLGIKYHNLDFPTNFWTYQWLVSLQKSLEWLKMADLFSCAIRIFYAFWIKHNSGQSAKVRRINVVSMQPLWIFYLKINFVSTTNRNGEVQQQDDLQQGKLSNWILSVGISRN